MPNTDQNAVAETGSPAETSSPTETSSPAETSPQADSPQQPPPSNVSDNHDNLSGNWVLHSLAF